MKHLIKSKKVGVFSDIHIGLSQDNSMWHSVVLEMADWIKEVYTNHGINDIIIPGDIFHNRSEIAVNTIAVAKQFFDKLKDFNIYILVGNHDAYYRDRSDVNSVSLLEGWNNIVIADQSPLLIKAGSKVISMIPWGTPIDMIPRTDICVGHFEINTFNMNSFKVCEHGVDSKSLLEKAPLVISGHFHSRCFRNYNQGTIAYVGSPYQQNFGDVDQERGIYILNLETNEFEFFENTKSPKHIKVYLSKLKSKEQDSAFLTKQVPNNLVSFVVDEEIESEKMTLLASKIQSLNPKVLRIDYKQTITASNEATGGTYTMVDVEKTIEDFVNSMDVQHKEEICSYLTELYRKITV